MNSNVKAVIGLALGIMLGLSAGYLHLNSVSPVAEGFFQKRVADLVAQVAGLQTEISVLQSEKISLQSQNVQLQTENSALQSENANFQDRIAQLETPRIVTRLGVRDCNWDANKMRLYIAGEVGNIGYIPAKNCSLHVVLYRGTVVVNETNVELGTLDSGSWAAVKANIHYQGSALTNWTIIPMFSP